MTIYFEYYPIGNNLKVTAIDEKTGIEVSVFGPRNVSQQDIENLAVRKLLRQIEKKTSQK